MLLAPNLFLGQFDHDDFWSEVLSLFRLATLLTRLGRALAELLGQVKPPVATKEDIEHSGLQVIKTEKIAEYAENGQIAINTIERVSPAVFRPHDLVLNVLFFSVPRMPF
jgi:hypothetical protein